MRRIIFEATQIKCFITCGPVRDLILNSRDAAFLLHSNMGAVCLRRATHTHTYITLSLVFFILFIYLFTCVGSISDLTPAADHQPPIIQVHPAPFILSSHTVQGKFTSVSLFILPCIEWRIVSFFFVILSKVLPTCFNINHTLLCCRGALQSRSETVDSCELPVWL